MSKVFIEESSLTAIGDAIRAKSGATELMSPAAMVTAIENISTGGGGGEVGTVEVTGNLTGLCTSNRFTQETMNSMVGTNVTSIDEILRDSDTYVDASGLTLTLSTSSTNNVYGLWNSFNGCYNLQKLPTITNTSPKCYRFNYAFQDCRNLREIPHDYITKLNATPATSGTLYGPGMFTNCYSLRELPDLSCFSGSGWTNNSFYNNLFRYCASLNKIENLPVLNQNSALISNVFAGAFDYCLRANKLTFATNNGTPYKVLWKNQTISLINYFGFTNGTTTQKQYIYNYNSGLTSSIVSSVSAYDSKKNTEDWTGSVQYARYNHDSAVETINSLPDASAYLASGGGKNTIQFLGAQGENTDGGAINTLTSAEIAVATAKGWTVSFS